MIYRLQKRFILICTVSVLTVIALVFGVILVLNILLGIFMPFFGCEWRTTYENN